MTSNHEFVICSAYELYLDPDSDTNNKLSSPETPVKQSNESVTSLHESITERQETPTEHQEALTEAALFKKTFCRENVHVHFVGVWCVFGTEPVACFLDCCDLGIPFPQLVLLVARICRESSMPVIYASSVMH